MSKQQTNSGNKNLLSNLIEPISNFFTKVKRPQPPKGLGKPKTE
ncbi:MAG: hypothetical protein ACKO3K_14040 [Cuspidothrix sp.]